MQKTEAPKEFAFARAQVIEALRPYRHGFVTVPDVVKNAVIALLLDRTKAAVTVRSWLSMQLDKIAQATTLGDGRSISKTIATVSAVLVGWAREDDEAQMLDGMQREMDVNNWPN